MDTKMQDLSKKLRIFEQPLYNRERLLSSLEGWSVHLFEELDSTNQYAKHLSSERAVVIAEAQSAGRGRLGRSFASSEGGVYFSLRVPVSFASEEAQLLTSMASVATHQALFETTGKICTIKWINDLYYEGKKVCGILTEGVVAAQSGTLQSVVIGIGINLFNEIPLELTDSATALFVNEEQARSHVDANELVSSIVQKLYFLIMKLPDRSYLEYYRTHSLLLGERVVVWQNERSYRATVRAIDEWARLEIEDENGQRLVLSSSGISIRLAR